MATTDIVTLTEATDYLSGQRMDSSPLLATWISAATSAIEDRVGPVVNRTITSEAYDGGGPFVLLRSYPVASVTTVTEDGAGLISAQWLLYPTTGKLCRRTAGTPDVFAPGERNIAVTYVAGRAASTSAVAPRIKQACLIVLAHMWRSEHGTSAGSFDQTGTFPAGFAIPNRALELLDAEMQPARQMGIA